MLELLPHFYKLVLLSHQHLAEEAEIAAVLPC